MNRRISVAVILAALSIASWAAPAPWYRWRSPESDRDICSQTMPGTGWIIAKGPYEDAQCKKLGKPGSAWK